jgi:esterase/lipase
MGNEKKKEINLKANSEREFFLIPGYTGGVDDFNKLPYILHKKFNANVKVINLLGHGTKIEDLDQLEYEQFKKQVENELKKDLRKGRKIVLGGTCFGGQLAAYFAAKYPIKGIFQVSTPYKLKFPLNLEVVEFFGKFKKYWKKRKSPLERKMRQNTFSYEHMHRNGLKIVKMANKDLKENLRKINCPSLIIHATGERIGDYRGAIRLNNEISSSIRELKLIKNNTHNIHFTPEEKNIYSIISTFIKKHKVFDHLPKNPKVAAIVPAYNESERISNVLSVLTQTKIINEIIVIDDGSTDKTLEIAKKFKRVKSIRNSKNLGKAESMERGVNSTNAEIIFFCDADLINFTPKIAEEIIRPVLDKEYDMFIGLRNNPMQKTLHFVAINSGERALRRDLWETLSKGFKHRYQIEAGLNFHTKKNYGGYGFKEFPYQQPIKERKYGFLKGHFLRWGLYFDVLWAYLKCFFK